MTEDTQKIEPIKIEPIRLNKYLSSLGLTSRRRVDTWIDDQKITVNDKLAQKGQKVDPSTDEIKIQGHVIAPKEIEYEYWKVYKPKGILSTARDERGRNTIVQMVGTKTRVYPVGRLDAESEGLMLLTNDGPFAHRLTHPKYHVYKTYLVWVYGTVTKSKLSKLQNGVRIGSEWTAKAEVSIYADGKYYESKDLADVASNVDIKKILNLSYRTVQLRIVLHEGKKRQIRRMCSAVGLEVNRLKRIAIGKLEIGDMRAGDVEKITKDMI